MDSVIGYINENADIITQDELEDLADELLTVFSIKIKYCAKLVYGDSKLGLLSFTEQIRQKIIDGLNTFLFRTQLWKKDVDVSPYIISVINNTVKHLNADGEVRQQLPACPACKSLGERSYLTVSGKELICESCISNIYELQDRIKTETGLVKERLEKIIFLRESFLYHSRKGYRCPCCKQFLPTSYIRKSDGVIRCPYTSCNWFGSIVELEPMSHPTISGNPENVSIEIVTTDPHGNSGEVEIAAEGIRYHPDAFNRIDIAQSYQKEISALKEVIDLQLERLKNEKPHKAIKKILMYKAFINMISKYPEDMVSYLVHLNISHDVPIQSRIFQEFIRLVENSLPFEVYQHGGIKSKVEVFSIKDPRLDLFLGESTFSAKVDSNGVIPNLTHEIYEAKKNFGPCFFGKLLDITLASTGESILSNVNYYTFKNIHLKDSSYANQLVEVNHLRIPSHYEMLGLVHLQRIRRKIVDSVYRRLHGKPRPVKKRNEKSKELGSVSG